MEYHIERLEVQPVAVVRAHVAVDGIPAFLAGAFGEVVEVLAAQGVEVAGPPFARYGMGDAGFDVEAGFPTSGPVAPTGRVEVDELPGGPAIVILHRGVVRRRRRGLPRGAGMACREPLDRDRRTVGGLPRRPGGRRAENGRVHALPAHLTPVGCPRGARP